MKTLTSYINATSLAFMLSAVALMLNATNANSTQKSIKILIADYDARQIVDTKAAE